MLTLRPNCECCNKDLPPESLDARICSFECTFCAACVDGPRHVPQLRRRVCAATYTTSGQSGQQPGVNTARLQTCRVRGGLSAHFIPAPAVALQLSRVIPALRTAALSKLTMCVHPSQSAIWAISASVRPDLRLLPALKRPMAA